MTTAKTMRLPRTVADCRDSLHCISRVYACAHTHARAIPIPTQYRLSRQSATVRGSDEARRGAA